MMEQWTPSHPKVLLCFSWVITDPVSGARDEKGTVCSKRDTVLKLGLPQGFAFSVWETDLNLKILGESTLGSLHPLTIYLNEISVALRWDEQCSGKLENLAQREASTTATNKTKPVPSSICCHNLFGYLCCVTCVCEDRCASPCPCPQGLAWC